MPEEKSEEKPGLLHHDHTNAIENPYDPDEQLEAATPEIIERAASESHHGVLRKPETVKLGREEEARLALENTEIKTSVAWTMTFLFLLTIFIPPILQSSFEIRRNLYQSRTSNADRSNVAPQIFDVLDELPGAAQVKNVRSLSDAAALIPDAGKIKQHEQTLEDESLLVNWMLPRAQYVLTKWGGVGNDQAYIGQDGWLFYRPDVDYLTSPGFLDPTLVRVRARAGDDATEPMQRDPVRAIVHFQEQLAARGIELIVMPVPVKPMLEAQSFNPNFNTSSQLQNPSYHFFLTQLRQHKIPVIDATALLYKRRAQANTHQFLKTDTHWTPQAMEAVARVAAAFIDNRKLLTPSQKKYSQKYWRKKGSVANLGDIATMLGLGEMQDLYAHQKVEIHRVFSSSDSLWQPDRNAEVLLLGDSFCNIYSQSALGWGSGAGFAEQLAYYLQRPIDSIIVNAGGSHTSRQRLIGEMHRAQKQSDNRLATTKVIVWEFSMRDLLFGDWKLLKLP